MREHHPSSEVARKEAGQRVLLNMAKEIDRIKAERTAECLAECSRVRKERQRGGYLR